jgi:hypothetical protein
MITLMAVQTQKLTGVIVRHYTPEPDPLTEEQAWRESIATKILELLEPAIDIPTGILVPKRVAERLLPPGMPHQALMDEVGPEVAEALRTFAGKYRDFKRRHFIAFSHLALLRMGTGLEGIRLTLRQWGREVERLPVDHRPVGILAQTQHS